jgi:methionyl-tRNA formyltransferase
MRILIIGRSELLYNTAVRLATHHEICGVVTAPATREAKRRESDFESLARKFHCPFLLTRKLDVSALDLAATCRADVAVSVNWVSVVGAEFIHLLRYGVLNAHCGDLPKYRGNAVINWAILRREPHLHICIHSMVPGILDMGDVYAEGAFDLGPEVTIGDALEAAAARIPLLFDEAVDRVLAGAPLRTYDSIRAAPGFRCYPRIPADGIIDWRASALDIDRLVRATSQPYPGAYTCIVENGRLRKLIVWRSRIVADTTVDIGVPGHVMFNDHESGETHVLTGQGILAVQLVQFADEAEPFAPAHRFHSIRLRLGVDIGILVDLLANQTLG